MSVTDVMWDGTLVEVNQNKSESQSRTRSESLCSICNIVSCDIITTSLCPKIQDWLDDDTHTHTHTHMRTRFFFKVQMISIKVYKRWLRMPTFPDE